MYRAWLFAFLFSTLFLTAPFSPGALAQNAGAVEQESVEPQNDLDDLVVTAGRVPEPKRVIPANITVIDEVAISQSTAVDLGELLAQNGFDVRQYPGVLTTISIRGFRTDSHGNDLKGRVLILLNGRRAGTGNAAKIMTKNIERVEIIRGPASVQYGSAAMGGVVNVITKRGSGDFSAFVEGQLGSFDFKEGSVGLSGETNGFDYSGTVTSGSWDDYTTANGNLYKNTGIDSRENGSLNLGYTFADTHRIGLIATTFDADESGSPEYLVQNDLDDYSDKSSSSVDFTYEGQTKDDRYLWSVRYFFGEDEDNWTDPTASNPSGWDDGDTTHREIDSQGAQAQVTGHWGTAQVTAGMDYIDYDIDYSYTPQQSTYENLAGFILGRMGFMDERLTASVGMRYDRYEVEMIEPAGNTEDDTHLGINVGLTYLVNNWLKLRAGYSEAFMMPSADELAADYTHFGDTYQGNPDLDPESSKTYEGGIDVVFGATSGSLTYFHTDWEDMIQSVDIGVNTKSWENVGEARIQGFEADMGWDMGETFNWGFKLKPYANLTWLIEYEDREDGSDLKYTPDLMFSYGIVFSGLSGFSCRLNATYTGSKTVDDWITYTGEFTQGSFTVVDFSLTQVIIETEQKGSLSLDAGINNLFDEDYEYVHGYPMPERNFYIGMRYTY